MPFCFLVQNFAEIRKSVDELWPKKRFSRWRPPPSWILKISIFGHVTVIGLNIWCSVPHVIKIGQFLTEIWRFNDFQNGGRPPSRILKICSFCHVALADIPFCFLMQNLRTIGRWVMAKKAIFKMAAAAILNFKKIQSLFTWLLSGSIFDVVYQISSKSDDFWQRYGDLTIFKMAAVRHLGF